MKKASLTTLVLVVLIALAASPAWAGGPQCDKASHFTYGPLTPFASWTFTGSGGIADPTGFDVHAPDGTGFPVGDPPRDCAPTATANIEATEVYKVADANGVPIDPIPEDGTPLGDAISAAFAFAPNPWSNFQPGDSTTIAVTVTNPNVAESDLGDYDVKLAAHDNGAGIGVGPGPHFLLKLRASICADSVPNVSITKLDGDPPGILGLVPLTFTARDTCDAILTMTAAATSSGGAVNQSINPLGITPALPVPALTTATATGSFTPYGGTGAPGTTDAGAFTNVAGNRSGIGTYTITAQATDASNNTGTDTWTFDVNYTVTFTKQSVPPGCSLSHATSCKGQFQFKVNRSSASSDGVFMYDHTVVVKLHKVGDPPGTYVATHPYGTGAIFSFTQIDTSTAFPIYQTDFNHIGGALQSYNAEVWFVNVDGTAILQATSITLTF